MKHFGIGIFALLILASCSKGIEKRMELKERTIEVYGKAEIEASPDEFKISISCKEYYKDGYTYSYKTKATKDDLIQMEAIEKHLKKVLDSLNINKSELKVTSNDNYSRYSGRNYDYSFLNKESKSFEITLKDSSIVQPLIRSLDFKGIKNAFISDSWISEDSEVKNEVKIKAVEAAKKKAEFLAKTLGKTVGEPITISETHDSDGYFGSARNRSKSNYISKSEYSSNSDFKDVTVESKMRVVFELK